MLRFAKVLRSRLGERARTLLVQLRGHGSEGDDDKAESVDDVEVIQPLGLFTRPTIRATLEAVVMELGEELVALMLGDKGAGAFSDVEEGETRLYGAKEHTSRVRLRAVGAVNVESKAATDIVFNGGSQAVARVDDTTADGTMAFTAAGAGANVVLTLTYTAPSGATTVSTVTIGPAALIATVPMPHVINGKITSGAARVKA